MDRNVRVILGLFLGLLFAGALVAVPYLSGAFSAAPKPAPIAAPIVAPAPKWTVDHLPIVPGDTMESVLTNAGVEPASRAEIIHAFADAYDLRKVRAGRDLTITRAADSGEITQLEYAADPDHLVQLARSNGHSTAELTEVPGVVNQVPVCATLQDSLAATIDRAGESFVLVLMMAEVLAYDIDFYREPQPGDDFCLVVEKKVYANGQPPTYRRLLAARYNNHGHVSEAYLYGSNGENGKPTYYGPKGESLKAAFLRSPLEFDARVSSHFSMNRLHPVLHTVRAHYGTDYAAPTGTPVQSVAAGKVVGAGPSGGAGNMVTIKHPDGYQTQYLHLSRITVRNGQQVEQGTRVGLVGSTGLATGPHLDLRISKNGAYMNWEKLRSPRLTALAGAAKSKFDAERTRLISLMDTSNSPTPVASR
jgi:murein DD-endopeptidase MepM/ murein hydrolase activator NlpD